MGRYFCVAEQVKLMRRLIVRYANEGDAQQIADMIYRWSRWQRERVNTIKEAISDGNHEVLVAELGGEIVGVLHQAFFPDIFHGGRCCYIIFMLVDEEHRGKGIGSQLLHEAVKSAERRRSLEVHVSTIYEEAARFYRKRGFKDDGITLELGLQG